MFLLAIVTNSVLNAVFIISTKCAQAKFSTVFSVSFLSRAIHRRHKRHNVEIYAGPGLAGCPFERTSQRKSSGCQRTASGSPSNFEGCNIASYCSSS